MGDDPSTGLQNCLSPGWGQVRAFLPSERIDAFIATLKDPEPFLLDPGATADRHHLPRPGRAGDRLQRPPQRGGEVRGGVLGGRRRHVVPPGTWKILGQ